MAKQNLRKKKGNEEYNPLEPSFDNNRQFNRAVKRRTQGLWRPQMRQVTRQQKREKQASRGQQKSLRKDFRWLGNQMQHGANQSQEILDQSERAQAAVTDTTQQNLMNALLASQGADANLAELMGSTNAPDVTNQMGSAISGIQGAQNQQLTLGGLLDSQQMADQGRVSQARLGGIRAKQEERARLQDVLQEGKDEKAEIMRSIPMLREQARKAVQDEEIAKQSERARQQIAAKSVKLDAKRLDMQGDQFDQEMGLRWAQLGVDQQQFNQTLRQQKRQLRADVVNATGKAEKQAAEQRMENYNSAVEAGMNWLEAQNYAKRPGRTNPAGYYRLMKGYGLGDAQILQLMKGIGGPVRKWAINRGLSRDPNGASPGR